MGRHKKGEHDKAIEDFELALESDLKTYGENQPAVATDRNNLGSVWQVLNKLNKAIEYFELALESVNHVISAIPYLNYCDKLLH
jgi:tetratricopeptide (TPR) repeat protein